MILTPSELLDRVAQKRQAEADKILAKIATILAEEFIGDPIEIWIHELDPTDRHTLKIITTDLYSNGWSIATGEKITDARNGDSVMFIITPIDSTDPLIRTSSTQTDSSIPT
jgi:hypothetical protein